MATLYVRGNDGADHAITLYSSPSSFPDYGLGTKDYIAIHNGSAAQYPYSTPQKLTNPAPVCAFWDSNGVTNYVYPNAPGTLTQSGSSLYSNIYSGSGTDLLSLLDTSYVGYRVVLFAGKGHNGSSGSSGPNGKDYVSNGYYGNTTSGGSGGAGGVRGNGVRAEFNIDGSSYTFIVSGGCGGGGGGGGGAGTSISYGGQAVGTSTGGAGGAGGSGYWGDCYYFDVFPTSTFKLTSFYTSNQAVNGTGKDGATGSTGGSSDNGSGMYASYAGGKGGTGGAGGSGKAGSAGVAASGRNGGSGGAGASETAMYTERSSNPSAFPITRLTASQCASYHTALGTPNVYEWGGIVIYGLTSS